MSERSERTMSTGFGEALCAEPFIGSPFATIGRSGHETWGETR
jgi:hypothetical protein